MGCKETFDLKSYYTVLNMNLYTKIFPQPERWHCGRLINGEVSDYDRDPTKLLNDVKFITGGRFNHAALLEDGTLWTWGQNITVIAELMAIILYQSHNKL